MNNSNIIGYLKDCYAKSKKRKIYFRFYQIWTHRKSKDIFARGKITFISHYRKGLRVIANMELEQKDQFYYKKYIKKIEDEIIKELVDL